MIGMLGASHLPHTCPYKTSKRTVISLTERRLVRSRKPADLRRGKKGGNGEEAMCRGRVSEVGLKSPVSSSVLTFLATYRC